MKSLLFLLISTFVAFAQGGSYCTMSTWEPRNITTKAGIVASYDPGNTGANVSNPAGWAAGSGVSALSNRVTNGSADLLQGTAANQPLLSRADNKGNFAVQSEAFNTTWTISKINAFGATDTGATGAGSFANTTRTTDPLGGNTADFVQEDGTSGSHIVVQSLTIPEASLVLSVYVKSSGRTWFRMLIGNGIADLVACYFQLTGSGVIGTAEIAGGASGAVGTITTNGLPSGWYLCTLSGKISVSGSGSVRLYPATGDLTVNYAGDNTSGLFLWGASLRPASWDSTYIATTTVPIYAGLGGRQVAYFDGSAYYLKTAAFTLNQPTEVYSLANPLTWTLNDAMFDGDTLNSGKLYQSATTPNIRYTAGTVGTELTAPPQGTWRLSTVVFDGASSRISTNSGPFTVSDAGSGNMDGFTLGAAGTVGTTFWNGLRGREIICNKTNAAAESNYIRWGMLKQASLY